MRLGKILRAVALVLIVVPIVTTTVLSFNNAYEVPFSDEWSETPILLAKLYSGRLAFFEFWKQHGPHRILFPRLALLTMAYFTDWNLSIGIGFRTILACLVLLVLWRMLTMTFEEEERPWIPWMMVAFSWLVFSTTQWGILVHGYMISHYTSLLTAIIAFWSLALWPGRWKGVCVASLAALVSTYSHGSGTMVWVVGLLILILSRRFRFAHVLYWPVSAATVMGSYLFHYTKPASEPNVLLFLKKPIVYIQFVLSLIGTPFGRWSGSSLMLPALVGFLGLLIFGGYTVWCWRKPGDLFQRSLPWLALGWFALFNIIVISMTRLGFGMFQAFRPHYLPISNLFWMAFLSLGFIVYSSFMKDNKGNKRALLSLTAVVASAVAFLLIGYSASYAYALRTMRTHSRVVNEQKTCVLSGCFSKKCGKVLGVRNETIFKDRIALFRKLRIGPFRNMVLTRDLEILPNLRNKAVGHVDAASWKRLDSTKKLSLFVHGWAIDPFKSKPAKQVVVMVNGRQVAQVSTGRLRPDVAAVFKNARFKKSGWQVTIPASCLASEALSVSAYTLLEGNKAVKMRGERNVPKIN